MAQKTPEKKKTGGKKTTRPRTTKTPSPPAPGREVNQGPLALLILIVMVVVLGLTARVFFTPPQTARTAEKTEKTRASSPPSPQIHKQPAVEKPRTPTRPQEKKTEAPALSPVEKKEIPKYEVFPRTEVERNRPDSAAPGDTPSRVAIIIDDIGYDPAMAEAFMSLGIPLTLSVLPHSPHGPRLAEKAHDRGFEVMLHLPMEPQEYPRIDPGPGGLLLRMGADEMIGVLMADLAAVPHIRGVNNHMGSGLTASESHMNQLFIILKKRNLFFIDSLTAAQSRCRPAARMFQVPFGERDVFLDHVQTEEAVRHELDRLFRIAARHGSAIGIGHPHRVTLEELHRALPEAIRKHRFVHASELTDFIE